jgi:TetR/AcrR family transcriptional repressor of nem operon
MKKSREETVRTRKRILDVAAREFRRNGILGTGLAEIMAAAGLSHGGFYRHFTSKDQLVAEALSADMDLSIDSAEAAAGKGDEALLEHHLDYLSRERCDDRLGPCALTALGSELGRADDGTRRAVSQGVHKLIDALAARRRPRDAASAKADAIATLSFLIGAATLSRIVDDRELSDAILLEAKKRLAAPGKKTRRKLATPKGD